MRMGFSNVKYIKNERCLFWWFLDKPGVFGAFWGGWGLCLVWLVWRAPQSPLHRTSLINNGELREEEGGGSLEVADQSNDATQKRHGYRTIQTSICLCWARTTKSRDPGHTLIQTTKDKNLLHPETARGSFNTIYYIFQYIIYCLTQYIFCTTRELTRQDESKIGIFYQFLLKKYQHSFPVENFDCLRAID